VVTDNGEIKAENLLALVYAAWYAGNDLVDHLCSCLGGVMDAIGALANN
jgi:hypothetical protein